MSLTVISAMLAACS
ncbi:hypothetical protein [Kingella negevensis]